MKKKIVVSEEERRGTNVDFLYVLIPLLIHFYYAFEVSLFIVNRLGCGGKECKPRQLLPGRRQRRPGKGVRGEGAHGQAYRGTTWVRARSK